MPLRFDVDYDDPSLAWDPLIDEVFGELTSSFLEMPRGEGFVEYPTFEKGYQALKRHTRAFASITTDSVFGAIQEVPIALVVFRCILGFSPSEWAHCASDSTDLDVAQSAARSIDRKFRLEPLSPMTDASSTTGKRIHALVESGVDLIQRGADPTRGDFLHRLEKVDTMQGFSSLRSVSKLGVPYPVLLYERFLGRPFASHRDSVSELVGAVLENAIKGVLVEANITFRETGRVESVNGFDQAPDFIVPDEYAPVAVIEAKVSEDDGTARDKVTRVQRLRTLRDEEGKDYDVIACIAGRGFKLRRNDMRRLLEATNGRVFTLETLDQLVDHTRIREYRC